MLFDGFQTRNNVRAAEAQVRASVESLRNTEQNTLFDAASAYMDVIRDRQIAVLTEQNLQFLTEQVARRALALRGRRGHPHRRRPGRRQPLGGRRAACRRKGAGRCRAKPPTGRSSATIRASCRPGRRSPRCCPRASIRRSRIAAGDHPAIIATEHLVDAAAFSVKSTEGALLPQVSASAGVSRDYQNDRGPAWGRSCNRWNVQLRQHRRDADDPDLHGGRVSAQVRQSKESLGQARIEVDVSRDQVRQAVVSAWTQYVAARESVSANRELVAAQQLALNGVIEERNVGQRTTLDVLNAQADVITAQINLASSRARRGGGELRHRVGDRRALGRAPRACRSRCTGRRSTTTPSRTSGAASGRPTAAELGAIAASH